MKKLRKKIKSRRRTTIFITGGVMSGVGKGVTTASIGALLKARGLRVTAVKIDPYLNVDPGTLNPTEHGEVFVTHDGLETDQDIGNYERFLDEDLGRVNYMTSGSIFQTIINRERAMGYGGKTVEWVPDVPNEIISRIQAAAELADADVTLVEIGGTVGEYQNLLYLEACRMMRLDHPGDVLIGLVSYLPIPGNLGEMKTKPTQYAARSLNAAGLQPDLIICRSSQPIDEPRKRKLSVSCNVAPNDVVAAPDVSSIYEVPLRLEEQHVAERIVEKLKLKITKVDGKKWRELASKIRRAVKPVRIGVVGKYFSTGNFVLSDAYLSVLEAIKHAAWHLGRKPEIVWLNSEDFERNHLDFKKQMRKLDGILIPGGWGSRGIEGKVMAIRYAREHKMPYLGLCYGMQLALVEVARDVLGWKDANTTEINPDTAHPVIHLMEEQEKKMEDKNYGGSMRLGDYPCVLKKGTKARQLYREEIIRERHRHRYEANPKYREDFEKAGVVFSGMSPDNKLAEIIEIAKHPFFIASQFHPELTSRPFRPNPLFMGFVKAAIKNKKRA
ncbi:MAG: CTP synthase [Patescibacteria group bacterium]|jgi:CTP synthase